MGSHPGVPQYGFPHNLEQIGQESVDVDGFFFGGFFFREFGQFPENFDYPIDLFIDDSDFVLSNILFSEFLLWCNSEGILTKVQSRDCYNRYFNDTFMSLPDAYNVCSSCPKKEDIMRDMEAELRQKEVGLMKACGDRDTYYSAHEQYNTILVVLEATCLACERGR